MIESKSLTISSWNIQGLYSSVYGAKSSSQEFLSCIDGHDIVILLETWCRQDTDSHCPPEYTEILLPSLKQKSTKRGRDSGGVIVWYKSELSNQLKQI